MRACLFFIMVIFSCSEYHAPLYQNKVEFDLEKIRISEIESMIFQFAKRYNFRVDTNQTRNYIHKNDSIKQFNFFLYLGSKSIPAISIVSNSKSGNFDFMVSRAGFDSEESAHTFKQLLIERFREQKGLKLIEE